MSFSKNKDAKSMEILLEAFSDSLETAVETLLGASAEINVYA